jgi:hypothetical protein
MHTFWLIRGLVHSSWRTALPLQLKTYHLRIHDYVLYLKLPPEVERSTQVPGTSTRTETRQQAWWWQGVATRWATPRKRLGRRAGREALIIHNITDRLTCKGRSIVNSSPLRIPLNLMHSCCREKGLERLCTRCSLSRNRISLRVFMF